MLVYAITSRRSISEKVVPFLKRYMEFSARKDDIARYLQAIEMFERGHHRTNEGLASTVVRLAYSMNHEGKQRQRRLEDVLAQNPQRPYARQLRTGSRQSDLQGDLQSQTETTWPLAENGSNTTNGA